MVGKDKKKTEEIIGSAEVDLAKYAAPRKYDEKIYLKPSNKNITDKSYISICILHVEQQEGKLSEGAASP